MHQTGSRGVGYLQWTLSVSIVNSREYPDVVGLDKPVSFVNGEKARENDCN